MTSARRIYALVLVSWCTLLALSARLYALQVVRHEELNARAERRCRRIDFVAPRRGRILDRKGRPLALDRARQDVLVELPELDPALELVPALARATRVPIHEVAKLLRTAREKVRGGAVVAEVAFARDEASRERARKLAARFPGLAVAPARDGWSVVAPARVIGVRDRSLAKLAELLGDEPAAVRALVQAAEDKIRAIQDRYERIRAWNEPILVATDVDWERASRIEEASVETAGISVVRRFERVYPMGPLAGHALGFLGRPSEEELAKAKKEGLLLDGDEDAGGLLWGNAQVAENARLRAQPVGRAGLEARLDARLAGRPGARVIERDAKDRSRVVLVDVEARDGEDVTLTLDADLQVAAERAVDEALAKHGTEDAGGAAVVLSVETGEVLALASAPRFDPNEIAQKSAALAEDPRHPLLHRAVEPVPPGSTFKPLSALAFLGGQDGLPAGTRYACNHALFPGKKGFRCDANHGSDVGLVPALAESCNVFFFKAADQRGADPLASLARLVGFGSRLTRSIPREHAGHVPDRTWKHRRFEDALSIRARRFEELTRAFSSGGWDELDHARARLERAITWAEFCSRDLSFGPGDVRNAAIGQGDVLATPLQVARLAGFVASGGRLPSVRFVDSDPDEVDEVELDARVLQLVHEGLEGCVRHGTASSSSIGLRNLDVAGKTGTAERRGGSDAPNYAWFMGYYPASRPEIAFATLIDKTKGHGGDVCGPIARKLVEAFEQNRAARARETTPRRVR